jgi:hypothetical protein
LDGNPEDTERSEVDEWVTRSTRLRSSESFAAISRVNNRVNPDLQ